MTFIRRLSDSVPIFVNPETQTEETATSQSQALTNFGIAGSPDLFHATASNRFESLQQQPQDLSAIQQSTSAEVTVDASSLFNYLDQNAPQPNSRLQQLKDRLDSVHERIKEIRDSGQLQKLKEEQLKLQQTAAEIRASANDDKALSNSILATLDGLGIIAAIGGFPVPQIVLGLLGSLGFLGLSVDYKRQMERAAAELEKKAGERDLDAEQLTSELDDLNKQAGSLEELINEEKRRLEQGFDEQKFNPSLMTKEGPWEEFRPEKTFVQNENASPAVLFTPDIQKLTNDE